MSEKVLKVDADIERWTEVNDFLDRILEEHDVSPKIQMQIDIALEELFVNIAHYAYPEGKGWAEIRICVSDGLARITLIDGGIPYDPLAKPDPDITLAADERQIGGLGIFMVKKQVDDMSYEYRNGHNILSISKKLG